MGKTSGLSGPRRRINPGYQAEGEILPDRQKRGMTGYPRLRSPLDDSAFRGSMVGEAGSAPFLPAIGAVIHSPLWVATLQGPASC
jgi:hypothetical protein